MSNLLLGQYEVLANIGEGSNGVVFKVRHHEQGYIRAVKMFTGHIESKESDKYKSFFEEYKTLMYLGNCSHPNIVNVHKADMFDNKAYYEMDYIDGVPLAQFIAKNGFVSMKEVYQCCHDLLSAMAYTHVDVYNYLMDREKDNLATDPNDGSKILPFDEMTLQRLIKGYGIIHNDIHSSNLIRNNYDGRYILLDFGISLRGGKAIRQSGLGEGALEYMAPEKIIDKKVSFQSDVYSIGIVMYEVLTGHVPFPLEEENRTSAAMYILHSETPVPSIYAAREAAFMKINPDGKYEKDYPDWLENIIMKCLEKKPENRYKNAKEAFEDFKKHWDESLINHKEYKEKALLYEDCKNKVIQLETNLMDKDIIIEELKKKNQRARTLLSANVKRGFAWILVVLLAIVVAVIYAPIIVP